MRPALAGATGISWRHETTSLLCPDAFLSPLEIDDAVTRALAEDLGRAGDVTSTATIPEDLAGARHRGRTQSRGHCGAAARRRRIPRLAPEIEIAAHARDGAEVAAKTALMTVAGPARAVLAAERARSIYSAICPASRRPRMNSCAASPAPTCASAAPARPRPACARWRNMRCAAAAASIIASGWTTPC